MRASRILLRNERHPAALHLPRHLAHGAQARARNDQRGTHRRSRAPRPHVARAHGKGAAALNPHGGEGGLFGDEEITLIAPTLARLRAAGVECEGPVPADTLFVKALAGRYDGVIMMYHDQGQIATKLIGFRDGVTVTSGLPTVFATPAHGTAYDIVGQGKADTGAMIKAFRIAASLAATGVAEAGLAQERAWAWTRPSASRCSGTPRSTLGNRC